MQTGRRTAHAGSSVSADDPGGHRLESQPSSRTGEKPPYGMIGGLRKRRHHSKPGARLNPIRPNQTRPCFGFRSPSAVAAPPRPRSMRRGPRTLRRISGSQSFARFGLISTLVAFVAPSAPTDQGGKACRRHAFDIVSFRAKTRAFQRLYGEVVNAAHWNCHLEVAKSTMAGHRRFSRLPQQPKS